MINIFEFNLIANYWIKSELTFCHSPFGLLLTVDWFLMPPCILYTLLRTSLGYMFLLCMGCASFNFFKRISFAAVQTSKTLSCLVLLNFLWDCCWDLNHLDQHRTNLRVNSLSSYCDSSLYIFAQISAISSSFSYFVL